MVATYSSSGWCHTSCVATYPSSSGVGFTRLVWRRTPPPPALVSRVWCGDVPLLLRRWFHASGVATYPFSHVKSTRLLALVGNPWHETQLIVSNCASFTEWFRVSCGQSGHMRLLLMHWRHFGGKVSRGSLQTRSKTDLRPRQFYAPVVPDASSRGRMIYGEITSFKSTHNTYSLIHVLFIDVDFFCYLSVNATLK